MNATSFSKAIMNVLFGNGPVTKELIESRLMEMAAAKDASTDPDQIKLVDPETAAYILDLWKEAEGDIVKFKSALENWFNRTMEQATEWYKRKIRIVLLVIGFMMAWFFNADTFQIIKSLSVDKVAREQLVSMANAYIESNRFILDTAKIKDAAVVEGLSKRLDSLLAVKRQLENDMKNASSILGSGCLLPDTDANGETGFDCKDKIYYFFRLFYHHFFGFLITAIAISLGAPFWFDLLNKLMSLKTSKKEDVEARKQ
jgi:hypothetical protein